MDLKIGVTIAALLHDMGKVAHRTGDPSEHSKSGADYLENTANLTDENILDCVRYHHAKHLKNADIDKKSIAYIVYMADNIASGADRRDIDDGKGGFQKDLPLDSIFNLLNNNEQKMSYNPRKYNVEDEINFPAEKPPLFDTGAYRNILANIGDNLKGLQWNSEYVNSLLDVLEANLSFVPSSTSLKQAADISLFNHVKLTAAFAAAMWDYLEYVGETDYKTRLFTEGAKFYDEKAFLMTTLDLSGIQKFIYTVHSEGALKNLRARSFYLDFMTEHIAVCLLEKLELTRANLLYNGGGRADLLLPNTQKTLSRLKDFCKSVNAWFESQFDIALFLAAGYVEASMNDLKNDPKGSYAQLHRLRAESIAENKAHRYTAEEIIALNERKFLDDTRECKVCKRVDNLVEDNLCNICASLKKLSDQIINEDYEFIAAVKSEAKDALPIPEGYALMVGDKTSAKKWQQIDGTRLYGKNKYFTGQGVATRLWIGDYHTGETFGKLAEQSTGVKRLGILRADVDNLGAAFAFGFRRKNGDDSYVTVSRTAELSRQLSMFFKLHIKKILSNPEFTMTGKQKEKRHAAIVYSGGDDLFIVGAWDDVIELAVDICHNFAKYTENTLTISGGIGIYPPSYPISVMAAETAYAEENSKNYPGKNAVTLPSDGGSFTVKNEAGEDVKLDEGAYSWDILEEKVIGEKLNALDKFFDLKDKSDNDLQKNERGKNFLYNLLELLRKQGEKIYLARYIYLLSRMEPDKNSSETEKERYREFADKMLKWQQNEEDRRQLKTAILLYVYLTRERNEG